MPPAVDDALAALLRNEDVDWAAVDEARLAERCIDEELAPLVHHLVAEVRHGGGPGGPFAKRLADAARDAAAEELARTVELRRVLDALAEGGVRAVLFKGAALAHTIYPTAACRPRLDTDLLIPCRHVEAAREVFRAAGYQETVQCAELFAQFEAQRTDRFHVRHAFDVHWRASTQPAFAELLDYDDAVARAQPVPALGPHGLALGVADALLVACVHPAMHHRNLERVLWLYDMHLLAGRCTPADLDAFAGAARERQVAAICGRALRRTQTYLGTPLPAGLLDDLDRFRDAEPSAEYLNEGRRWWHELVSGLRAAPSAGERLRWLRRVVLPPGRYMLASYGLTEGPLTRLLLPLLYVHRNVRGVINVAAGRK